jgi:hypothetical protein
MTEKTKMKEKKLMQGVCYHFINTGYGPISMITTDENGAIRCRVCNYYFKKDPKTYTIEEIDSIGMEFIQACKTVDKNEIPEMLDIISKQKSFLNFIEKTLQDIYQIEKMSEAYKVKANDNDE